MSKESTFKSFLYVYLFAPFVSKEIQGLSYLLMLKVSLSTEFRTFFTEENTRFLK